MQANENTRSIDNTHFDTEANHTQRMRVQNRSLLLLLILLERFELTCERKSTVDYFV